MQNVPCPILFLSRELPNPKLELFDLDEAFSSEKSRLAQITNKCSDADLDYFVREAADIMGITQQLPVQAHDAKHIMEYVLTHIVEFKKLNQGGISIDILDLGGFFELAVETFKLQFIHTSFSGSMGAILV